MSNKNEKNWRQSTKLVRGGLDRSHHGELSEAMFLTQAYAYDSAEQAEQSFNGEIDHYVYSRYGNPTVSMFENRLALLEGADHCRAMASGMAAVYCALASKLKSGDRVVASRALFGGCEYVINTALPKFGIKTEFVDGSDLSQWEKALAKPVDIVFIESPANPTLEIIDIAAVAELTHKAGGKLVVDNAFASPILQKPLELGADIVTYSATKHIDGQGRVLGGAILSNDQSYIEDELQPFYRNVGPSLSPFNAWVLVKSLETIELRVTRQSENALAVASFLETLPSVDRVLYPGLSSHPQHDLAMKQMSGSGGTVVSFEIAGGRDAAFKALNKLSTIDIANNLGDLKSMITHPQTT
ncbi:MAG: aminotransferase class I/II-fold pyridoxal phosphate-dependent enzyme, partial [Rhodospirillaceae bacterium]|nr:aminotransferase class I/II-fold pyridoxal phosphate-dependent enzyme [Rhodospirillaceae bacterium]